MTKKMKEPLPAEGRYRTPEMVALDFEYRRFVMGFEKSFERLGQAISEVLKMEKIPAEKVGDLDGCKN